MTSARTRTRLVDRLRAAGIRNARVLEALRHTPRHLFVDEALAHRAYEDTALPIGYGQTISQPYIVARMTEALLAEGSPAKVLEVGTGCGYQTAILAQVCGEVFTIECIEPLFKEARRRLNRLRLPNIHFRLGNGYGGWPEAALFDGIIVAAAPEDVPTALLEQLAPGGRLVIPVGNARGQELRVIQRTPDGYLTEYLESVNFVPLVRAEAVAGPSAPRGSA